MHFPNGATFAFSILDDTDDATVDNVRPLYDLLGELGFRTTKTAWPLDCPEGSPDFFAAQTLQHTPYLEYVHRLVDQGFELASHGATMESSRRSRTKRGLEFFQQEFGFIPILHANHGANRENMYWGANRYHSRPLRAMGQLYSRLQRHPRCSGEDSTSPYFWGDLCREHFRFVRSFTFADLNMLAVVPRMVYQLPQTPFVRYWFCTSDASDVWQFNRLVTPARLDRLADEGGVCIISTHLGKGFADRKKPDRQVVATLRHLADLRGWFAPVSQILEHVLAIDPNCSLKKLERRRLEVLHVKDRIMKKIRYG